MPLLDVLRRRLTHRLESHHIEEDYSFRGSLSRSRSTSPFSQSQEGTSTPLSYDPTDDVPSYEVSQLMHVHQQHQNSSSTNLVRRQGSSNQMGGDPILSLGSSTTISRRSSIAANSTTDVVNTSNTSNGKHTNNSIKNIGLKFLNARQHFMLACCRDLSLIPSILGLIQSWKRVFHDKDVIYSTSITSAKLPEHFLTGIWCIVAGYLSYSVLDGLMIRWIVTYLTSAAILRMLSMSTIILTIEQYLVSTLSAEGYKYGLHIWILISCCLTFVYIVQNFVTLNLDLKDKRKARFFDLYNIVVFAVVPVGLASFVTMIGLLRSLLIVRLDVENSLRSSII